MNVLIDDLAWVSICLAVVTVFFVISVAFIFLDEGLRILFSRARQWLAGPSAATQAISTDLSAGRQHIKEPAHATGKAKQPVYGGKASPRFATVWHTLQSKLHAAAEEGHTPFRWGHR